jgi:hypothetical protein
MKKIITKLFLVTLLTAFISGCNTTVAKQRALGQDLTGTLLEGMGPGLGVSDVQILEVLLDNLVASHGWISIWGSEIIVSPALARYMRYDREWGRNILIRVDGSLDAHMDVRKTEQGWKAKSKRFVERQDPNWIKPKTYETPQHWWRFWY